MNFLNQLELESGRVRDIKWGPRTLDLDIIFYEEEVIHTDRLIIPHADMHNRPFVLEPLCEIAPYAYHPIFKRQQDSCLTNTETDKTYSTFDTQIY